ncbi:MAG TPA: FG-GAP repeat protein [Polyangiaceae bacterium]|nr:FG-GAP repeat protein [Polyangiaceae bacterium]
MFRGLWLAASLAGFVSCADLVGADFDHAKARASSVDTSAPDGDARDAITPDGAADLGIVADGADEPLPLQGVHSTQTAAQFGAAVAIDARGLAIAAPLEDVQPPAGDPLADGNPLVSQGGAVYYYDLGAPSAQPQRVVAFNVAPFDGLIPPDIHPIGFNPGFPRGSVSLALGDATLVVGVGAEGTSAEGQPWDRTAPFAGAAYAYDRAALGSAPQFIKSPTPHPTDLFGLAVAISGPWLAIGAPGEDQVATDSGAVYVYQWLEGKYVVQQRLQPSIAHQGDSFGYSVAVDGDLLVAGAWGESSGGTGVNPDARDTSVRGDGAAYVFRLVAGTWTQEAYLKPGVPLGGSVFGSSVAVSKGTVAAGAPGGPGCPDDKPNFGYSGTAYLFAKQDGGWIAGPCVRPRVPGYQIWGYSVSLFDDLFVVGAPWEGNATRTEPTNPSIPTDTSLFAGTAHLYVRDATGAWRDSAYVKAPEVNANDVFGYSVAVTPSLIAIGAPYTAGGPHAQDASTYAGAVYLFPPADPTRAAASIAYH